MTDRKHTAPRAGEGTRARTSTTNTPPLAELLSAVMRHPDTPARIYNDIQDALLELEARQDVTAPEAIARALADQHKPAPLDYITTADTIADLINGSGTPRVVSDLLLEFCSELSNNIAAQGECVCSDETRRKHLPALLARATERGLIVPTGGVEIKEGGRGGA
ncbi:MAG TPA: hypothetical protein VF546_13995 [Pyrinomonadaceae bacterium]|jgi:3-oxoacyl-ACP reductase-like protein